MLSSADMRVLATSLLRQPCTVAGAGDDAWKVVAIRHCAAIVGEPLEVTMDVSVRPEECPNPQPTVSADKSYDPGREDDGLFPGKQQGEA